MVIGVVVANERSNFCAKSAAISHGDRPLSGPTPARNKYLHHQDTKKSATKTPRHQEENPLGFLGVLAP